MSIVIRCAWKWGRSFLAATLSARDACSRRVYRVFVSDRDFLMKNTGFCCRCSSSLNKAALTETSDTTK